MCGRFAQYFTYSEMLAFYGIIGTPLNLEPRYNIAPTTQILTIRNGENGLIAVRMRWGLVPGWWKDDKPLPATFNARADGVATKPMYRAAFREHRCILPMSGFYEWKTEGTTKRPFYITRKDGKPLSVAAIWDRGHYKDWTGESVALITTEGNATMQPIHDRMPAILECEQFGAWLSGAAQSEILKPAADDVLEAREVSQFVNKVANQGEECIAPLSSA